MSALPSSDNMKAIGIGVALLAGAYVVYKLSQGASSIGTTVSDSLSKIGSVVSGLGNPFTNAWSAATGNQAAVDPADESAAEMARLTRQNGQTDAQAVIAGQASGGIPAGPLGALGGAALGYFWPSSTEPQTSSPDALGSTDYFGENYVFTP